MHYLKYRYKALLSGKQHQFSTSRIAVSASIFVLGNLLQVVSLVRLSPTMYQMLLGSTILFTPLISRMFLKKKLYYHTIFGIVISFISLVMICFSSFVLDITKNNRDDATGKELMIVTLLMLGGVFLVSIQRVYEEVLIKRIEISNYRFVGLEGLYGVIFLAGVNICFLYIQESNDFVIYEVGAAIEKIIQSVPLIISSLVLIASTTIYSICGIIITKKVSATYRVVNDVLITVIVWLAELLIYDLNCDIYNDWTYLLISIWKLSSYGLLIFGNVLINEVREIRCFGLNKDFGKYNDKYFDDDAIVDSEEFSIMKT